MPRGPGSARGCRPAATAEDPSGLVHLGPAQRVRAVTPLAQTFSAGVACWDAAEISEELVARADRALYAAKAAGRDRIVSADEVTAEDQSVPTT